MNAATATHEKKTFFATYDWAKSWHELPWAHDEPTLFLPEISSKLKTLRRPGRALDIGCGAGTDSVFLAKQGWEVTSLDFMPKALAYTEQRAREAGVSVTPVEADVTQWEPTQTYDLVLDHGLLHNMDPVRYPAYRERVLKALATDGDFVLLHWHPLFPGQAQGKTGPLRVSREDIQAFFAPDLQERFFAREEYEDLPDIVGGGMTQAYYWFRRNHAHDRPAELLAQIHATLKRQGLDGEKVAAEGGLPPLEPGVIAKLLGPGRLGISHRLPEATELHAIIQRWSALAGQNPQHIENLFNFFTNSKASNFCNASAPKCDACEVRICKRLRFR